MSVYERLKAQADQRPNAIAVMAPGRRPLSYAQLRDQISQVVTTLNSLGIGRNDRVAVVLPNGPEAAVVLLGVAAGATCAPLDPRSRPEEFQGYLAGLDAKAVILPAGSNSPILEAAAPSRILLVEIAPALEQEAGRFAIRGRDRTAPHLEGFAEADDIAFLLHTSGTTSRAKLVPLTQSNVAAGILRVQAALGLTSDDRYLNVTSLFYSQGIMLTMASLCSGGSVTCPTAFNAQDFAAWVTDFQPTWYSAAPAVHQAILTGLRNAPGAAVQHRFRFIRSAAGPLPAFVRNQLEQVFQSPVIEAYGMTECYPISSNPLPPGRPKPGSAGLPADTDIGILGESGQLLPVGSTGEIVVRGPHVTPGYLNELADDRGSFVHGWFRTGDEGHLDQDGYLFVTGRIKEIINRGGEKISPVEVEHVLLDHPAVSEAASFSVPHATLGEDVAVAVVLSDNESATEQELRAFAATRLSPFKVPRRVVFVDALPKNATGKVQRHILSEKFGAPAPSRISHSNSSTRETFSPVHEALLTVWAPLLGIDSIGIGDNFFDLGGDSLLAVQMIAEVEHVLGKLVPLPAFFLAPTIEHLADVLAEEELPDAWPELVPTQPHGSETPFFWVHGDGSTWFLANNLGTEQPVYGLEHQSRDGKPARYTTVETIAAHYIDEVQRVQPAGPYRLGGFSFGGTLAFEMAQQLRARGEVVDLLVLLDSRFPGTDTVPVADSTSVGLGTELRRHIRAVSKLERRAAIMYVTTRLTRKLRDRASRISKVFKTLSWRVLLRLRRPIPTSLVSNYLLSIYEAARSKYRPVPYFGRAVYIKSEKRLTFDRMSWERVLGDQLEWHEVPGDHMDLVTKPYAESWTAIVKAGLDVARRKATAG
jgi:oxalate---CoA ligase